MYFAVNSVVCLFLGGMRLLGVKSVVFQAIAHVYVGGLFVYGWQDDYPFEPPMGEKPRKYSLWLAIALTVVEVIAFVGFKYGFLHAHN